MRPRLWLVVFVVLQLVDGVLTYAAVERFGTMYEGNPLLVALIAVAGTAPAVFGAKLVACACGGVLYATGVHRVLALLSTVYLFVSVMPWLQIFVQMANTPLGQKVLISSF